MMLTSISKEKNLLIFGFDNNKTAIYDFNAKKAIGVSGKEILVKNFLRYVENADINLYEEVAYGLIMGAKDLCYRMSDKILLTRLEQWFSYTDLLDTEALIGWRAGDYVNSLYDIKMDKGYIKYLKENGYKISYKTFQFYKEHKTALSLSGNKEENEKLIHLLCDYFCFHEDFWELTTLMQKKLIKSLKVDLKNYNIPRDYYDLRYLLRACPTLELYYDDNRGLDYNVKQLNKIKDREREKSIFIQEEKIFDLEKLDLDDLQVVVPHTLEAFADEGIQQNNCVGSFYHDSIAKGENLIYFIRKKKNPAKSYITCRYNIKFKCSVETREINNTPVKNVSPTLFSIIDKEIARLLKIANN